VKNVALLCRRELGAYFKSPMGYVIVAVVLAVDGLLFNAYALGGTPKLSSEVLELFFSVATFMSNVSGVLLSMRLLAEERQSGTLNLLFTAPIKDHEIVLGKFLSAFIFFLLMTLLTVYMPLLIFVNGKISVGHLLSGYLGLLLLGMAGLAVGLFASSLTRLQVVAAVAGGAMMAALWLFWQVANITEQPIRDVLAFLSPWKHLAWQHGIIESRDVIYYASVTYVFLLLTTHTLQARRWR
jgi:ABC-2 type transport system permease protein